MNLIIIEKDENNIFDVTPKEMSITFTLNRIWDQD